MLISNKKVFYELAFKRLCGNTPIMWDSFREFTQDESVNLFGEYGIRSKDTKHRWCFPRVWAFDILKYLDSVEAAEGDYIISKIPTENQSAWKTFQGELSWSLIRGEWVLFGAEQGGYQRKVLQEMGQTWVGCEVVRMLRKHCDADSFDDLFELMEIYTYERTPPVIEFAVFPPSAERIGWSPNRNTLIWEVRHY